MAEASRTRQGAARSFEDLWIWQQSRGLVSEVYLDFGDSSAAGRDFGFRSQVQRSAISIMNNIAEGFERMTDTDFARLLDIAKGSAGEVRSMYYAAEDLKYVSTADAEDRRSHCRQIGSGISSLAKHLRPGSTTSPRRSGR